MKLKRESALRTGAAAGGEALFAASRDFPKLVELPIEDVRPRPDQPRRHFDEEEIRGLAASIGAHGLLQPIIVAKGEGGYDLVAGERRWRACRRLGRATIFAIVSTGQVDEVSLVENLQRVDLAPLEQARAFSALMRKHGYTQDQAAQVVGKGRHHVHAVLRILDLPPDILEGLERGASHVSMTALLHVAREEDPEAQRRLWAAAVRGAPVSEIRRQRAGGPARQAPGQERQVGLFLRDLARAAKTADLPAAAVRAKLDDAQRRRLAALRDRLSEILDGV